MNNLYDALDHIEKTIFLLGEDLVTLTVGQGLVSLPAVALAEELLKPHDVVNHLGTFPL
jgi:hypothetical protein